MRFDPGPIKAVADQLIDQFGEDVVLVQPGEPTGPPSDPRPGLPTLHPSVAVPEQISMTNRNETLVLADDQVLILSSPVAPQKGWVLKVSGLDRQIVEVQPIRLSGTSVTHRVKVRK